MRGTWRIWLACRSDNNWRGGMVARPDTESKVPAASDVPAAVQAHTVKFSKGSYIPEIIKKKSC
jgi:hypothetical protein